KGVAAILLGDDPEELVQDLQDRFPKAHLIGADSDYESLVARIVGFVEAPKRKLASMGFPTPCQSPYLSKPDVSSVLAIPGRVCGSPSDTRGKSRVREFRSHGSVRGAVRDDRPYRDQQANSRII